MAFCYWYSLMLNMAICIFWMNLHLLVLFSFSLWLCWHTKNSLFADSQRLGARPFNKLCFLTALPADEDRIIVECGKTTQLYWWLLVNKLNWGRRRQHGKSHFLSDTTWKLLCWDQLKSAKEVHGNISVEVIFSASIELIFVMLVLIGITETY